jgi:hypothetical protein
MFSYDKTLASDKDKVRFYIQDNKEHDVFFEDEEIEAMLQDYRNPKACAIQLCYTLAALFAGLPDEKVGPYSVSYRTLSEKYTKLADSMRTQQNRTLNGYAGGLDRAETLEHLRNKNITKAAFTRFMMRNHRG